MHVRPVGLAVVAVRPRLVFSFRRTRFGDYGPIAAVAVVSLVVAALTAVGPDAAVFVVAVVALRRPVLGRHLGAVKGPLAS